MARAVGIDFKFTGDSTKAVAAFRQVAAAAKASGGDIGAAGRQIESALNKAEAAAAKQQQSLRAALGGGTQSKGAQFLQGLTDSLGLGEFTDQFGGVEGEQFDALLDRRFDDAPWLHFPSEEEIAADSADGGGDLVDPLS